MDNKLVSTPVDLLIGNPNSTKASGAAKYGGESGLPQRTNSKNAVDEVTFDQAVDGKKG